MGRNLFKFLAVCFATLAAAESSFSPWKSPEVWEDVPGTRYYKVYIFNVTNADEALTSNFTEKINLEEVGPYVYLEKHLKFNISQNLLDGSYNFKIQKFYEFLPTESIGFLETDLVNVINVPLIAFATRLSSPVDHYMAKQIFEYIYNESDDINGIITRNITVKDLVLGGVDVSEYVDREKDVQETLAAGESDPIPGFEPFATGRFGLIANKNAGDNKEIIRVQSDIRYKGNVVEWNDKSELGWWPGTSCNIITGTEGNLFPENIQSVPNLNVFTPEICRSIKIDYKENVTNDAVGFPISKYQISDKVFQSSYEVAENACYCPQTTNISVHSGCTKRGIYYAEKCKYGVPYVISEPHFLNADSAYSESVTGLSPSESRHKSEFYVEPITGTVVRFNKRFQWNVKFGPLNGKITNFNRFPETIFPLMWTEETFELSLEIQSSLQHYLFQLSNPPTTTITPTTEPVITIGITSLTSTEILPKTSTSKAGDYIRNELYWISQNVDYIMTYLNLLSLFYFICALLFVLGLAYMFISLKRESAKQRFNYRTMSGVGVNGFGFNYDLGMGPGPQTQIIVTENEKN